MDRSRFGWAASVAEPETARASRTPEHANRFRITTRTLDGAEARTICARRPLRGVAGVTSPPGAHPEGAVGRGPAGGAHQRRMDGGPGEAARAGFGGGAIDPA